MGTIATSQHVARNPHEDLMDARSHNINTWKEIEADDIMKRMVVTRVHEEDFILFRIGCALDGTDKTSAWRSEP
jgi:hypothetical protein